jgi:type II secretory pathway pseudopilin PulG
MPSNVASGHPLSKTLGFSLVEVVVVVTLVAMGTAFAVPRFTSLGNRARASEVVALSARLRDATQVAHNQFVASGSTLSAAKLKGKAVILKNGYPAATSSGIGNAVVDSAGFTTQSRPSYVTFFKTGAPLDAQCSVTYKAAPQPSIAATITDIHLSGC